MPSADQETEKRIREAAAAMGGKSADEQRREEEERARARLAYLGHLADQQARAQVRLGGERYKG